MPHTFYLAKGLSLLEMLLVHSNNYNNCARDIVWLPGYWLSIVICCCEEKLANSHSRWLFQAGSDGTLQNTLI